MIRAKLKKPSPSKKWDLKWSEDMFEVIHKEDEQYVLNDGLQGVGIRANRLKVK